MVCALYGSREKVAIGNGNDVETPLFKEWFVKDTLDRGVFIIDKWV